MTINKLKTGTSKLFIREVAILTKLPPHKNIVRLVEVVNQPIRELCVDPDATLVTL